MENNSQHAYSNEELEFIRSNLNNMTYNAMAAKLGRTYYAVKRQILLWQMAGELPLKDPYKNKVRTTHDFTNSEYFDINEYKTCGIIAAY
jgi:hypothetical protein